MIKKLFIIIFIALVPCMGFAIPGWYNATTHTGSTASSLDSIEGETLSDGDKAIVAKVSGQTDIYNLDVDSALDEDSTNFSVISPDSNAGDKRWVRVWSGGRVLIPDSTVDQGDSTVTGTLAWHIDNASSNPTTVRVLTGTYKITTDITIPATMNLELEKGALLKPDAAKTITVNSPEHIIASPRQQIIDATSNSTNPLLFTSSGTVHPGWWGGTTSVSLALAAFSLDSLGGGVIQCLTATYTITTTTELPEGVNILGTHTPNQDYPTQANVGTIFNRTADVAVLTMTGTHRTTARTGKNNISGIAFQTAQDASSEAVIDAKYADNVIVEKCEFNDDSHSTTVGHMVDAEECWDWTFRDCHWKHYGNAGGTKHGVNLYNGDDDQSNHFKFQECRFGSPNGYTIVSDVTGGGDANNSHIHFNQCKFEDVHKVSKAFIYGTFSNVYVFSSSFIGADDAMIDIAEVQNFFIIGSGFGYSGTTATELIRVYKSQRVHIVDNRFDVVGDALTSAISVTGGGGNWGKAVIIKNNHFYETVDHTLPMVLFTDAIHPSTVVKDNGDYQNETVTADATALMVWEGYSYLDSDSNKVDSTLGSGIKAGDIKVIVMTNADNSSTVTIAALNSSNGVPSLGGDAKGDGEVGTFNAVDETWVLMWTGTEWTTLRATCTFL